MEEKHVANVPDGDPVVESASATTDHEHNHAGVGPVVGVVCALAVLCLLALGVGGCTSSLLVAGVPYYWDLDDGYGYDDYDGWDGYGWDDDYDGWDGTSPYDGWDGGLGWDDRASVDKLTLEGGLEAYVESYDVTIDDYVAASDYSGVPQGVRDWVKGLCTLDATANGTVVSKLRPALASAEDGDDEAAAKAVEEARQTAADAAVQAAGLADALPEGVEGREARLLAKAARAVAERWDDTADALAALGEAAAGNGSATLDDFEDTCREGLNTVADNGYESLMEALSLSAS